ncbi:MAG TPA: GNAT family N-acetyltransferase, partial [Kiloniellales bacterium]|nr:GNAT family N-acetyltransferase [Kiloniellales bacterium]
QAVRAFMHMVNYRRSQETLIETPPSIPQEFTPDTARARTVLDGVLQAGRSWLTEPEAKQVLEAYAIPVGATQVAATPHEAAAIAARLGVPVALKILSPDVIHKTDVGGVALGLEGPAAVEAAAVTMLARVSRERPDAHIEGFAVETMIRRPGAHELIVGVLDDVQFGPVILFGQGGTAVEVLADRALALPPLNMRLARELMARTRIYKLLEGVRGQPTADLDEIALTLIKVAQLVTDFAEIVELDVNPLLADDFGVMALDARIKVGPARGSGTDRLAIRPYPKELEETLTLQDGQTVLLRPVMPEDEPSLQRGFAKLTPEEIRLRFFAPLKALSHVQAARFSQIDYDREMALLLTDPGIPGTTDIYGVVRIVADPNNERAEYAIIVRKDMTGRGLGRLLMQRIIDYARRRGIAVLFGDVLRENTAMLELCKALGFSRSTHPDEPDLVRVELAL